MLPPRLPVGKELSVLLSVLLLLLFVSPIAGWWASYGLHWFTPYAIWLAVILGAALIDRGDDPDEP